MPALVLRQYGKSAAMAAVHHNGSAAQRFILGAFVGVCEHNVLPANLERRRASWRRDVRLSHSLLLGVQHKAIIHGSGYVLHGFVSKPGRSDNATVIA